MNLELLAIDQLIFDPNNARKHSTKNLDAIKGSLTKFGQQKPIVVNKKNIIIAGNGTVMAAKDLGWKELRVIRSELDDFLQSAFALADNRTSELAEWDDEILKISLSELQLKDFDIQSIGFDPKDYDFLETKSGNTDDDHVPEVPQNIHGVKLGDIWSLGNHRLMCGDSTSKESVEKLMGGIVADVLFTSPPYNAGKFEPSGKVLEKFRKDNNKALPKMTQKYANDDDDRPEAEYFEFLEKILINGLEYAETVMLNVGLLEGAKRSVMQLLGKYNDKFKEIIYWNKKASTPHIVQGILTMIIEPIFCFGNYNSRKFPKGSFKGNLANLIEGHNAAKDNDFAGTHSATFPVYLPEHIANYYTEKTVLDLFMGTGTTFIACEKTGRTGFGMELDPHYCSVIIERWQQFTGLKAEKISG